MSTRRLAGALCCIVGTVALALASVLLRHTLQTRSGEVSAGMLAVMSAAIGMTFLALAGLIASRVRSDPDAPPPAIEPPRPSALPRAIAVRDARQATTRSTPRRP
jgi:drug/metabolite transporter (DMT)-like permease